MVSIYIMIIAAIAAVATIGYTVYSFYRSSEIISVSQSNVAQMQMMSTSVGGAMRMVSPYVERKFRVPFGDTIADGGINDGKLTVPSWIVGSQRTPWGSLYGYCPSSIDLVSVPVPSDILGTETKTVVTNTSDGTGYGVVTAPVNVSASVGQKPYVVRSEYVWGDSIKNSGAVAFIISPVPFKNELPRCDSIVMSEKGMFSISGNATVQGIVTPVYIRGPASEFGDSVGNLTLYVKMGQMGSDIPTGNTGTTANDPISLVSAINKAATGTYKNVLISLEPGSYSYTFSTLGNYPGTTISFTRTKILQNGDWVFPSAYPILENDLAVNGEISAEGIIFGGVLTVGQNGKLLLNGGQISKINNNSGEISLNQVYYYFQNGKGADNTHGYITMNGYGQVFINGGTIDSTAAGSAVPLADASGGVIGMTNAPDTSKAFYASAGGAWNLTGSATIYYPSQTNTDPFAFNTIVRNDNSLSCSVNASGHEVCQIVCPSGNGVVSGMCEVESVADKKKVSLIEAHPIKISENSYGWECRWHPVMDETAVVSVVSASGSNVNVPSGSFYDITSVQFSASAICSSNINSWRPN